MRLGLLDVGDQLPTVREVVAELAINPNTVAKAYRDLERDGLVVAQQGRGTFVRRARWRHPRCEYHDSPAGRPRAVARVRALVQGSTTRAFVR